MLQRTGSASFLLPGEAHFGNFSPTETINLDRLRALLPPEAAPLPEITFPRADSESRQHVEAFLSWCATLNRAQHDFAQELHFQLIAGFNEPVFRGAVELLRRGALEAPLPEQKPGEHWGHLLARLGTPIPDDTPMQLPQGAISLSDRFETLDRAGFKFDAPGGAQYSPHLAALYADNTHALESLWQVDSSLIDRPIEGRHPLHIAAAGGCEAALNLLLERSPGKTNVACDRPGETPLHCAARAGHTRIVYRLIQQGDLNANAQRTDGASPLFLAAKYSQKEVVCALINAGATVDLPNSRLRTPLHIAAHNGHIAVVETLLSNDADTNQADQRGVTPLHMAAHNGHNDVVKTLLSKDAAINQAAQGGRHTASPRRSERPQRRRRNPPQQRRSQEPPNTHGCRKLWPSRIRSCTTQFGATIRLV